MAVRARGSGVLNQCRRRGGHAERWQGDQQERPERATERGEPWCWRNPVLAGDSVRAPGPRPDRTPRAPDERPLRPRASPPQPPDPSRPAPVRRPAPRPRSRPCRVARQPASPAPPPPKLPNSATARRWRAKAEGDESPALAVRNCRLGRARPKLPPRDSGARRPPPSSRADQNASFVATREQTTLKARRNQAASPRRCAARPDSQPNTPVRRPFSTTRATIPGVVDRKAPKAQPKAATL